MIASNLELHRMGTKRDSRVITALTMLKSHLFKYQGHVGAALVLAVRSQRPASVHGVSPRFLRRASLRDDGSSLAAMAVFEADFKEGMDEEEAKGSSRVPIARASSTISARAQRGPVRHPKEGVKYLRNHETPNERTYVRTKGTISRRVPPAQPTQLHDRHVRHPPAQRDCDHQRRCPGPDGDVRRSRRGRLSNINRHN